MKRRMLAIVALLALALCGCSVSERPTQQTVRTVTGAEAQALMDGEDGYAIVDVRTPEEFAEAHVPGAINIPVETIDDAPAELADRNQTIYLYCRRGNRSARAAATLAELGYTSIVDFGALSDWPGEVVSE